MQRIELPWPSSKLSPNGAHGHWRVKSGAAKDYKYQCAMMIRAQKVRPVDAVQCVCITFHPPSNRRYDLDNALAKLKQGLDALAEALGVDDAEWQSMVLRRGEKVKGGLVVVSVD